MPEDQNPADIAHQEQRAVPRFQVDDDATLLLVSDGRLVHGRVLDLSLKGCRMRTKERFSAGTDVRVEVTFRVNGIAFRFFGLTQWTNQWNVVGIQFIEVPKRRLTDLAEVVGEVEEEAVARSEMQALEESSIDLDVAPLAAEATMIAPAATIGEEQSPDQARIHAVSSHRVNAETFAPSASHPFLGSANPGRRVLLRQAVDTSATISLIPGGSKQNGLILELSLSGCRIRTEARFAANIYARAEIEFHLEGVPFRLAGVIQAIEDQRLVAIKFLDISERKRTQLAQLIQDIEENHDSGEVQKP
jgi:hypothetical protein